MLPCRMPENSQPEQGVGLHYKHLRKCFTETERLTSAQTLNFSRILLPTAKVRLVEVALVRRHLVAVFFGLGIRVVIRVVIRVLVVQLPAPRAIDDDADG